MADATFTPGYKFNGACFKKCKNRDKKCKNCFRINGKETEYEPYEERKED